MRRPSLLVRLCLSLPLAFVILVGLTTGGALAAPFHRPLALAADPQVQSMLNQVSTDALYNYMAGITGQQPVSVSGAPYTITTRFTDSGTPVQKAGQFVGQHMQGLGMSVEYHTWGAKSLGYTNAASTYPNVIGQITGATNPGVIYMIGAHLDDKPGTGIAPGADDNASGSVATLIAADILSRYQWSCTLRFAFWTGEEQGMLGSQAYAARSKSRGENIKGYLNLDMLAYKRSASNDIDLFARSYVPGSTAMQDVFANVVSTYGLNLTPVKYLDETESNYSDNRRFWDQNYASIWVAETDYLQGTKTDPYNHQSTDTLSTLDMAYYTEAVRASIAAFVHTSGCLVTGSGPTYTPTPTNTMTPRVTSTSTNTAAPTDTFEPTIPSTPTNTAEPTNTAAPTDTPTITNTPTPTNTAAPSNTPKPTSTPRGKGHK